MKIVTPISSISELDMLLHNGADELYCGLGIPEWDEMFGQDLWINRRSPDRAGLHSLEELESIVAEARSARVRVSITLNASFYPENAMDCILRLCDSLVKTGVDSLIVSDLNFLMALSRIELPVRIHLSSLGSCFNSHAVDFYRSLGVKRIILPRQLTLPEMASIVKSCSDRMEFEVFALNDGCYFEEGFCQTSHGLGPFCLTNWDITPLYPAGTSDENKLIPSMLDARTEHFKSYLWFQNNCGSSFQQDGLPNGPCSLCSFCDFREWGVTAVKIVGREASFHRKMGSLQLVKAVRDKTRALKDRDRIEKYARDLRRTPDYCDAGYMCYFRKN